MIYVIEFDITATCKMVIQNKCRHVIILLTYCMIDIVSLIYFKNFLLKALIIGSKMDAFIINTKIKKNQINVLINSYKT